MIIKRQSDIKLNDISEGAPVEYDTFVEVATELNAIKAKLDLITITEGINLDNISTNVGTLDQFDAALLGSEIGYVIDSTA